MKRPLLVLVAVTILAVASPLPAQTAVERRVPAEDSPRIALVLNGGGAYGRAEHHRSRVVFGLGLPWAPPFRF